MTERIAKCSACRFWQEHEGNEYGRRQNGDCHKAPPPIRGNEKWPMTHEADWCGEFRPKPSEKPTAWSSSEIQVIEFEAAVGGLLSASQELQCAVDNMSPLNIDLGSVSELSEKLIQRRHKLEAMFRNAVGATRKS